MSRAVEISKEDLFNPPDGKRFNEKLRPGQNLSEDGYLISVEHFLEHKSGYNGVSFWMRGRLRATAALLRGVDGSYGEVSIFTRPCNHSEYLSPIISFSNQIKNSVIDEMPLEELPGIAVIRTDRLEMALRSLDPDNRPTHILLTYDDDYALLQEVAKKDEKRFQFYLATKELARHPDLEGFELF